MFKLKYLIRKIAVMTLLLCVALSTVPCHAVENPLKVVATQTMYSSVVKEIGKDKVDVKYVAPPKFNVHFIQPKPTDVRNITKADLYVDAGLDLEAWSDSLLEASGKPEFFRGRERNVDMSKGIRLLEVPDHQLSRAEGDIHFYYAGVKGLPMLLLVLAAIGCYAMSLAPVTWVLISEIFPNRIRGAAVSVAVSALWIACFFLIYTFKTLNHMLGTAGTFWVFAGICVAGFFFILARVPETKGKTLEQIERELTD